MVALNRRILPCSLEIVLISTLLPGWNFGKLKNVFSQSGMRYLLEDQRVAWDNPKEPPHGLSLSLVFARRTFLAEYHVLGNHSKAHVRLLKRYKQLRLQQYFTAECMPAFFLPNDRKKILKSIGSVNSRQKEYQQTDGLWMYRQCCAIVCIL
ncbi:hypothetical protein PHMEG_00014094 [Phytophthora megakarya]|uniref:Uncharacterized protein n=1 Tax=Phytophthora megakarya TaxID=4795 RepID=A0A225W559_9STRA|nr:hypothetical protein PHMEG_00014094 [Phytophthora megakarya]